VTSPNIANTFAHATRQGIRVDALVETVKKVKMIKNYIKQVYKNNAFIRDRRLQAQFEGLYFY
jgi:hypothetical protein